MKEKHYENKRRISIFTVISIIVIFVCVTYILLWLKGTSENNKVINEIKEESISYDEIEDNIVVDFENLKQTNPDTVAWIKVNNTEIDYPVVKTSDNSYYLNHSFNKSYNTTGWIFMDYRVNLDESDKNITIYGHNIKNGSMFGSLKNILSSDWYENEDNLQVTYIDNNGTHLCQVFSIYEIEKENYYTNNFFSSDEEFDAFLNTIKSRSIVDFDVQVTTDDKVLTLSTCSNNNNYRVVLHAKYL